VNTKNKKNINKLTPTIYKKNQSLFESDAAESLVNGLLLIYEINEIARETQCFTFPCHSIQGRFDFTNIIFEKEICRGWNPRLSDLKQCSLTPRPSRHCPTTVQYNVIVLNKYYNIFLLFKQTCTISNDYHRLHLRKLIERS